MNDLPGDHSLPPGVSENSLSEAAGDLARCERCGSLRDAELLLDGICPKCIRLLEAHDE